MAHNYKYETTVRVYRRFFRGAIRLFMHFDYNYEIQHLIKSDLNGRWSETHKGWYVDDSPEMKNEIVAVCRGRAWYDMRDINKYLDPDTMSLVKSNASPSARSGRIESRSLGVNQEDYDRYIRLLKSRGKSKSTIETYGRMVSRLAQYYDKRLIRELDANLLHDFLSSQVFDMNYSNSYHRQMISALKLFYGDRDDLELDIVEALVYPKKHRKLPNIMSEEEVLRLLQTTRNLKHRVAFALLYSCGLRIGELIDLQLTQIDLNRRTITVKRGKGNKDRVVMLAESVVPMLQNYVSAYRPVKYLLNGGVGKLKYTAQSVRKSLANACSEAGIRKKVTPHTLRHSFATHLLEQGVGIRYIQELLGHAKPETTMIYTYVANDRLLQISSPLDHIVNKRLPEHEEPKKIKKKGN